MSDSSKKGPLVWKVNQTGWSYLRSKERDQREAVLSCRTLDYGSSKASHSDVLYSRTHTP